MLIVQFVSVTEYTGEREREREREREVVCKCARESARD
jgi:hypothetical protein